MAQANLFKDAQAPQTTASQPVRNHRAGAVLALGQMCMTRGIALKAEEDEGFRQWVQSCLARHSRGDWGEGLCDEDRKLNDQALPEGEYQGRILSAYLLEKTKIWIITEWDRSVTTILYPHEY